MLKKLNAWFDQRSFVTQMVILVAIVFVIRTWGFGLYQVPTPSMETTMLVGERFFADKLTPLFRSPKRGQIISFNDPTYCYSQNPFVRNVWEKYVWGPSSWTKRVIGVPGDHVRGTLEDGKPVVYVNNVKLDEPYINKYPIVARWDCPVCSRDNWMQMLRDARSGSRLITYRSWDPNKSPAEQPFYKIAPQDLVAIPFVVQQFLPGTPYPGGKDIFDVQLGSDEYWAMGDNRLGSYDSREWGPLKASAIHGKILYRIFSVDTTESWWILDLFKHPLDFFRRVRWSRCVQRVH